MVTWFTPRAIILPSLTTTAPKGPPLPSFTLAMESRIASNIYSVISVLMHYFILIFSVLTVTGLQISAIKKQAASV
jgi:hypothetical protein